ncbi:MAG: amidohydrolase [Clostridia bacterium]|nr:amidohydrolase [Clostridia bacterium]
MKILFQHARILTMDDQWTEYTDGWLLTDGKKIAALGQGDVPAVYDEMIDCRGGILIPGLVNTHCHVSMVPFRTMGDDCPDRLRRFLFPLENEAMTPELVYLGALYGMAEMLLSGVTTFVDMYYYEEEVAHACIEMGMRGYLGETVISQKTPDSEQPDGGLAIAETMMKKYSGHDRVRPIIAPHGTTTVSEEALKKSHRIAAAYDTLLTLHVSEMDYEMQYFADQGTTPIQYLDNISLCDRHLLAAHCIHATEADIALLAEKGASVAHCIGSNTKAGKGVAPMRDMARAGISFGFGTDGPSSGNTLSLFDQMRLFAVCQKTAYHDRSLFPAREIVRAATRGGAEALHGMDYGILRPGYKADITLVATDGPAMFPLYNPYSALVYSANASDVSLVMADGDILVRNGQLIRADLSQLRQELYQAMGPFNRAAEKYADMI